MAKLCTVVMTEMQVVTLMAILLSLKRRMEADGRSDLSSSIEDVVNSLAVREVTPVQV